MRKIDIEEIPVLWYAVAVLLLSLGYVGGVYRVTQTVMEWFR